ncbi:MAG TPA: hypothetical protein DEP46_12865, partial [Blastocatellia bacterium]|nr:hypothetical protein [Blastocatellia bacterium]
MNTRFISLGLLLLFFAAGTLAQPAGDFASERELARLAVEAHGGEKFRTMKTLVVTGGVDITT